MIKINLKSTLIFILVSVYTLIVSILLIDSLGSIYINLLNPLMWLLLFVITLYLNWGSNKRVKGKKDKAQTVFIVILFYLIIYFLSGLFFGYSRSPFSHDFLTVLKNIWTFLSIIVFQEYIRFSILNGNKKSRLFIVLTVFLFILVNINFLNFQSNFVSGEDMFKYVSATIVPVIAENILFTYLSLKCGCESVLAYRLPIIFANIILPIFPDLDWFVTSLFDLALCFVVFICINYLYTKKYLDRKEKMSKKFVRKQNPVRYIPFLVILFVFVGFVAGFFKYMPIAIMSNSMANLINRGDIVVIDKLNEVEKKSLKVYDIIEYELEGSMIVHRIVSIETDNRGNMTFTTKGDNNSSVDTKKVKENQIRGLVKLKVPLVGYPVVWLNDFFTRTKPNVEMGK